MRHVHLDGGSLLACLSLLACTGATPKRPLVDVRMACEAVPYQSLRIIVKDANAGQSVLTDAKERAPELNLRTIIRLEGAGARCVSGFKEGFFLMAHGAVFKMERRGYLVERDRTQSPFARTDNQAGPFLNGKAPQSVAAFNPYVPSSRRIAVWNLPSGSSLGVFPLGAKSGEIKVINRSRLALRDINFASGPDTPTGLATVIHEIDRATIEVLGGVLSTAE